MNQVNLPTLSYRAEIDGLRAIAVVSVILYHAQMVLFGIDWFEGGYIGVDIFFVISGYLITRIILSELQTRGSFSFINFYERRARRILPVLFVVIFVSIPYAWQNLLPLDLIEYAESILASLFFGSNFFFYFSTTEYGADSALLKPFLHTWSLGVEEQFYIVFPIIAIIAFKFFRKHFLTILVGLSFLSLQFAELMEVRNSDLNFYLPFSRFWELAIGSMLAYRELNYDTSNDGITKRVLPTLGLYLIVYSILFFDNKTPHPSFHTLIPIIGVALIIGFSSKDELVGKILGSKLFVWIGLISYSLYLWHFPIFAFSRMGKEPSNFDKIEWIALTFFLSIFSYFFIEKPFRSNRLFSKRAFAISALISFMLTISLVLLAIKKDGFPSRFPQGWLNYEVDANKLKKGFWNHFYNNETSLLTPSKDKVNVYIFGNSHSIDFLGALYNNSDEYEEYHFLKTARLEQLSCFDERDDRYDNERNALYSSDAYRRADVFVIATAFINSRCSDKHKTSPTSDADGLSFLIPNLKRDGKKIIILGNTLRLNKIEGKWLEEKIYLDSVASNLDFKSYDKYVDLKETAEKKAYEIESEYNLETNQRLITFSQLNGLSYFDRRELSCNDVKRKCLVFDNEGYRIRWDYGHFTLQGRKLMGKLLKSANFDLFLKEVYTNQIYLPEVYYPYEGSLNSLHQ